MERDTGRARGASPAALRRALRWLHLAAAAVIGTYLYSPWAGNAAFSALALWVAFPAMALSGIAMWQQRRLAALPSAACPADPRAGQVRASAAASTMPSPSRGPMMERPTGAPSTMATGTESCGRPAIPAGHRILSALAR